MTIWSDGMSYQDEQKFFEEALDAYNKEEKESMTRDVFWQGYSAEKNPNRNNGAKNTTKCLWLF
ncbi:MAG: hypothetical protein IKR09_07135 [Alphaproteobacteria bacterium]|nr:hypothetical protein [Alphaproteobacteria bacterium]